MFLSGRFLLIELAASGLICEIVAVCLERGSLVGRWSDVDSDVAIVGVSHEDSTFLFADANEHVWQVQLSSGSVRARYEIDDPMCAAVSALGDVAFGCWEEVVIVSANGTTEMRVAVPGGDVTAIAWLRSRECIVCGTAKGTIVEIGVGGEHPIVTERGSSTEEVDTLSVSFSGRFVAGKSGNHVIVYSVPSWNAECEVVADAFAWSDRDDGLCVVVDDAALVFGSDSWN